MASRLPPGWTQQRVRTEARRRGLRVGLSTRGETDWRPGGRPGSAFCDGVTTVRPSFIPTRLIPQTQPTATSLGTLISTLTNHCDFTGDSHFHSHICHCDFTGDLEEELATQASISASTSRDDLPARMVLDRPVGGWPGGEPGVYSGTSNASSAPLPGSSHSPLPQPTRSSWGRRLRCC